MTNKDEYHGERAYSFTTATATGETATTTAATTTSTVEAPLTTFSTAATFTATHCTFLGFGGFRLASNLDGHLALKDFLARELLNSVLGLMGGGQVDKSIANRTVGTRIHRNGNALTIGPC